MRRQRWALVTGAASGIGAATVLAALERDYWVVAVDTNAAGLEERYADQPAVRRVVADVSDSGQVEAAFEELPVGAAAVVVTSAGISRRSLLEEQSEADWRDVIDVNLTGTMLACRAALRRLGPNSVIVTLASIAGHRSFAGRAAYCASKAGVLALTEVVALEGAHKGIRAVAVSPGFVRTGMAAAQDGFVDDAMILSRTPVGRLAKPTEIGAAILALADPAFRYLTGSAVVIDGGWCANGGFWPMPALEAKADAWRASATHAHGVDA